ncbi:XrtB/PEP-CTERM-associated polysaccharide biosynthesis outer membrane protein EpsL [Rhodoferax sp. GW822-FHT02A01]|uniref:XrtB/PEP-CTERM-associated polysaccharide biosynthesis outer membrane protein EpsL n=1 Tax=Rhodoferax sp. GW822-FHT02A01 TaxID=3141537 RepID=UPI00315C6E89
MSAPTFTRHVIAPYGYLLTAVLAWPTSCLAETDNPFSLRASVSSQNDSNIFRQSAAASEQISTTSLGLGFKTRQSLQGAYVNVNLVDNKYQNFSYLNYTATNYDAAWQFAVTPRLQGSLSCSWQESLNSYADVRNTTTRYLNSNRSTRLDASYDWDGAWSLSAGLGQTLQNSQRDQVQGSDFTSTSSNLGLGYTFGSGSKASISTQSSSGQYLDQPVTPGAIFDDSFSQTDNEMRLHWAVTATQAADLYVANRSVTHPHVAARNYSGTVAGLSGNWAFSGKTSLSAGWARELSTYQTIDANYSQTERITLGADWQILAKLGLVLRHDLAHITYLGGPFPAFRSRRQDDVTNTTLALTWTPRSQCTVSASLQSSARTSNSPGLDYTSSLTALTATLSF